VAGGPPTLSFVPNSALQESKEKVMSIYVVSRLEATGRRRIHVLLTAESLRLDPRVLELVFLLMEDFEASDLAAELVEGAAEDPNKLAATLFVNRDGAGRLVAGGGCVIPREECAAYFPHAKPRILNPLPHGYILLAIIHYTDGVGRSLYVPVFHERADAKAGSTHLCAH
jgi:hypothetical protein